MTKLIVETDNDWTRKKIKDAINTEAEIFRKTIKRIQKINMGNLIEMHFME